MIDKTNGGYKMGLVNLKDAVIDNIEDDTVDYEVFGSTFTGSNTETSSNFTFSLEDGRIVELKGFLESYYGSPSGFNNYGTLIVDLLRKVSNKETEDMTIADFVNWAFTEYAYGKISITLRNSKYEIVRQGLLKRHEPKERSFLNNKNDYLNWVEIVTKDNPAIDSIKLKIKEIEEEKPEVFVFNKDTFECAGSTLEDFLIV